MCWYRFIRNCPKGIDEWSDVRVEESTIICELDSASIRLLVGK